MVHRFVRAPDGYITEFDVTGAGTSAGQGTYSWSINDAGAVTAEYVDAESLGRGYVRAPDGAITAFDVPLAVQGTVPGGNNSAGVLGWATGP